MKKVLRNGKKKKFFKFIWKGQGKWDGASFGYHEVYTVKCVVSILESKGGVFFSIAKKHKISFVITKQ